MRGKRFPLIYTHSHLRTTYSNSIIVKGERKLRALQDSSARQHHKIANYVPV